MDRNVALIYGGRRKTALVLALILTGDATKREVI